MKSALLTLLLFSTSVFAAKPTAAPPSSAGAGRVLALYSETIPELQLRDVSLPEAVEELRMEWERHHPKEMFPVAITDYRPAAGVPAYAHVERITLNFVGIPYIEALQQLAQFSGRELKSEGEIVRLERVEMGIVEDYITREYSVSPELLAALGLKPDSDSAAIRSAFEHYGLEFNQYMKFLYIPARQKLVAMSFHAQLEQIAGVLFLLGKGFHISK